MSVISRVAIVPHPPLLVPELAAGAAVETASVRDACLTAVRALTVVATEWIAVGAGDAVVIEPNARGSFLAYGADVPATLSDIGSATQTEPLPLPALVAAWLRGRAGATSVRVRVLDPASPTTDCVDLGRRLDEDGVGLLVLGDGANRHGPCAPGGQDDRAAAFDAVVAGALGRADAEALAGLDPRLAAELGAGGRVPWQVLAGLAGTACWRAELLYSAAPFGVGYHVAVWDRR